jgi:DNA-binding NarL/FixJ family response regulator
MTLQLTGSTLLRTKILRDKRIVAHILLADEMDLVTYGARIVLLNNPTWTVVGECHSLNDTVRQLDPSVVDVVVCGEQLDPGYDALRLVERLRAEAPNVSMILIGSSADGRLLRDLLSIGLRAYLHRGDPLRDCLPTAVHAVLRESLYLSPTANTEYLVAMQSGARRLPLDMEARTVLRSLVLGYTVGSIAVQMNLPPRRVYWICEKLRNRFGAATNEQMIICAVAEGYATTEN